ncbi:hypothetical protein CRYO30217_00292 [Parvicella tangerina]|uniref:DUF4157 domain-containing protein n=2 Tax=Parvicella tangerina TaxID=2829795 RepID=A0A916NF82_9FLAO|nr:hypothetical protein CRYO30217_00292 [Parvicella tangerina]
MVFKRFIAHYDLVKWVRGDRNAFNEKYRTPSYKMSSTLIWFLLIPVQLLDLLKAYDLFDEVRRVFIKTRELTSYEKREIRKVFGDCYCWDRVHVRENSQMAKVGARVAKKKHLGFVLFRTINFSRRLDHSHSSTDISWLIHEVVHVLQYEELGAQYIIEALRAQRNGGYGYGKEQGLEKANCLASFNLEQQAEIARDYYQLLEQKKDVSMYEKYVEEIRNGGF